MDETLKIEEVVKGLEKLPTLPGIAVKILEAVRNSETSLKEIADILSADLSLSAEVLKAINSPFYGLRTKVTSVHHAVNLLGLSSVKSLALSFSLVKNFQAKGSGGFNHTNFWKDSLIGAVSAKVIAEKVLPNLADDAFFLGLLQNIGILTLADIMPKQYSLVVSGINNNGYLCHEAETQILGFNHMEIGQYLTKSWGLPDTFYTPIGYHHYPDTVVTNSSDIQTLTKLLHLSSLFIELFSSTDMSLNLALINHWMKTYGFSEKIDSDAVGAIINEQAQYLFALFDIEVKADRDYEELLEAAKVELANLSKDLINDLLEKRREIESLRQQIDRDSMTQLINHQRFKEMLEQEISRAERHKTSLSVIMADIDHFKSVNDTYGHLAGDCAIKTVADCLRRQLREYDQIARYGGEEFGFILPETQLEDALKVAERLRKRVESLRVVYEGKNIPLTMSFGVAALLPKDDISREEFIKRADSALYEAKEGGRNRCCPFVLN